jgi:CDP-diacylglycerol--glycerol-3-phosphate 3-phosphatidyltransferase
MSEPSPEKSVSRGFYSAAFTKLFRSFFYPVTRFCKRTGITPNAVTWASFFLGAATGVAFAMNHLYTGLALGLVMGFADIVDGQLAKEFGGETKFGGVLDSTIDRYNEFFVFAGYAWRYASLGREIWIIPCALAFFGSVMISYIKSRAETAGYECKVGRLQRPERLTVLAIGTLFLGTGIDIAIGFLAVATQFTAGARFFHVWRQSRGE